MQPDPEHREPVEFRISRDAAESSRRGINSEKDTKMKVVILLLTLLSGALAYQSRGWRPPGPAFNPARLQQQRIRPALTYGPPTHSGIPTTGRPLPEPTTTTTERSIEQTTPTTSVLVPEPGTAGTTEDFDSNPALAIANSFAFNRPIYVYNAGFPFHPAYTFLPQ
ncbi:uncharacterized protein LOC116417727 [Nasonia vitripennis]|uniref:Uncharacterized protein n=1 Tax=Nasonia vitripennis TaxID=7425 RepID=A0A7M7QKM4_NASVI|nr:uncharacterized protein LOC116417727 [Nasonia vitripennis]